MNPLLAIIGLVAIVAVSGCTTYTSLPTGEPLNEEMTSQECTDLGGEVIGDPGDGSSYRCNGRELLGFIPLGIEGAACCEIEKTSPATECTNRGGQLAVSPQGGLNCPVGKQLTSVWAVGPERAGCCE